MTKYYNRIAFSSDKSFFGKARGNQPINEMNSNFDLSTLEYLNESVINHLADSLTLEKYWQVQLNDRFNDFSFTTAPAYKAFEGFLFQIAAELNLPTVGNPKFVGTYFDEQLVDKTIDSLLQELETKSKTSTKLSKDEKIFIKDQVVEMKRFLQHYRHTPAHFHGEPIDSLDKAKQNVHSIYRIINETIKILLKSQLVKINDR